MMLNYLIILMFFLTSIAFFTIMERKILGTIHLRLGPNKLGMIGMLQPFSDAMKLFSKEFMNLSKTNMVNWNISPLLIFFILIMILNFIIIKMENNNILFNMLMVVLLISLPIFPILMSSFFSGSKFSLISSKRLISQMISYEMGLIMILILFLPLNMKLNIMELTYLMNKFSMLKIYLLIIIYILILSESSRMPFDFIEGESELVSGFNTEYSMSYFSLFFIYEYGMMIFFSVLISLIMMKFIMSFMLMYMFILIRGSFPRLRYDQMMLLFWKFLYPITLSILILMKTN